MIGRRKSDVLLDNILSRLGEIQRRTLEATRTILRCGASAGAAHIKYADTAAQ